jgi:hypothetical protein
MNTFQKRTAIRIAAVSILLASIASPVAWFVARESAEESVVSLATEESGRLLHHYNAVDLSGADAMAHATAAANTIAGGLFDIAEIYDSKGQKLAESLTNLYQLNDGGFDGLPGLIAVRGRAVPGGGAFICRQRAQGA